MEERSILSIYSKLIYMEESFFFFFKVDEVENQSREQRRKKTEPHRLRSSEDTVAGPKRVGKGFLLDSRIFIFLQHVWISAALLAALKFPERLKERERKHKRST